MTHEFTINTKLTTSDDDLDGLLLLSAQCPNCGTWNTIATYRDNKHHEAENRRHQGESIMALICGCKTALFEEVPAEQATQTAGVEATDAPAVSFVLPVDPDIKLIPVDGDGNVVFPGVEVETPEIEDLGESSGPPAADAPVEAEEMVDPVLGPPTALEVAELESKIASGVVMAEEVGDLMPVGTVSEAVDRIPGAQVETRDSEFVLWYFGRHVKTFDHNPSALEVRTALDETAERRMKAREEKIDTAVRYGLTGYDIAADLQARGEDALKGPLPDEDGE